MLVMLSCRFHNFPVDPLYQPTSPGLMPRCCSWQSFPLGFQWCRAANEPSLSQMGHDLRTLIPSFCYRESSRIIWAGCVHGDLLLGATLAAYANAVCCGQRDRHSVLTGSDVSFWMWMMMMMMMMMNVIIVIMYLLFLLRESWFLFER